MFSLVTDYDEMYKYMTHPWCVKHGWFDESPPPELFFMSSNVKVVRAGTFGAFIIEDKGKGLYSIHLALTKDAIGAATWICQLALKWAMKELKGWVALIAQVPKFNHKVKGLAVRLGFKYSGDELFTVHRDGKEYAVEVYVLKREDV